MCAVRQRRVKWLQSVQIPQLYLSLCPASEIRTDLLRYHVALGSGQQGSTAFEKVCQHSAGMVLRFKGSMILCITPCDNYFAINPKIQRSKPDAYFLTFSFNLVAI